MRPHVSRLTAILTAIAPVTEALGAWGQLAVVNVGQPAARHRAEPAVGGRRRGLGAAAVAEGFAQPSLGLCPGGPLRTT